MMKRLTALFLCLCMVLTLLPATAYAAIGGLLGNSQAENQALLEQLEALTGQDGETIRALLEQYGLLDENGNLVTDRTVELNGVEYTLEALEALLSDPGTDLSQIGYVDGVPVALGDLRTIIAIERQLQYLQETYFSGQVFEGEALENLNALMDQLQTTGISMMSEGLQAQSASGGKKPLDVSTFKELQFGIQYGYGLQRSITSGAIRLEPGEALALDVAYDPGLVGNCIDRIEVSMGYAVVTLTADNPIGRLEYTSPYQYDSLDQLRVYLYGKNPDFNPYTHYSYGSLAASLTFSDPTGQVVFQDGGTYSDVHTLLLTTERKAPDLSTSWSNADYTEQRENASGTSFIFPILSSATDSDRKTQVDRINDLIAILQGAKGTPIDQSNAVIYTITGELYQSNSDAKPMILQEKSGIRLIPDGDRTVVVPFPNPAEYPVPSVESNGNPYKFTYSAWSKTGTNAVFSTLIIDEPYSNSLSNYCAKLEYGIKDCTVTLENDNTYPTLLSVTAPAGTYYPGQVVPITLTFDEFVKVADGAAITVNDNPYSAAALHMNTAGNRLVLWYRVRPVDSTGLTVSFGSAQSSGVSDLWNNAVAVDGETVAGVTLVSTQRRNAVTGMEVEVKEGADFASTATVSITLTNDTAYQQDIMSYNNINGVLPFRAAVYGDNTVDYLPIKLQDDGSGNTVFATDPYSMPAGTDATNLYHAVLQVNEGTADSPNWIELSWLDKSFSNSAIYNVTRVWISSSADTESGANTRATIDAATQSTYPTLTARLYAAGGNPPTYTTGTWTYERLDGKTGALVTFEKVKQNDDTQVVVTPISGLTDYGWIRCIFTADNGTPDDDSDDVVSTDFREFYVTPGMASYLNFSSDTVTTQRYAAFTLRWNSNLGTLASSAGKTIQYTVNLYQGDFTAEDASLEDQALVETYTVDQDTYSVEFPAGMLSAMPAESGGVAYTVVVSASDPQNEGKLLSARMGILLETQPVTARLIRPADLYITDKHGPVEIGWELEGLTEGQAATFTIQRVRTNNNVEPITSFPVNEAKGSYTLNLSTVSTASAPGLKDTYQVTLTVDNGDQAPSTDAFALHVYNSSALWLVDEKGDRISNGVLEMDNDSQVMNYYAGSTTFQNASTEKILALRQQLGLLEYIGVNYDQYSWNSFRDGIRWATSNDAISINYKQGGLYENIKNFSYDTYLPELLMGISATEDGFAVVTATHAATGMTTSVTVSASTLKDKFYLFQVTPAAETTLRYTNGAGRPVTVTTNADGVLALYESSGIASDVQLSSEVTESGTTTEYLGTIEQAELLSGERDATKLQLYPLNTFRLREAAKVELTLVTPDGSPLANSTVTVRGGVFKNGVICGSAGLGASRNTIGAGGAAQRASGTQFTTDANGKITVYFNPSQFTTAKEPVPGLLPSDQIQYVLEISGIANDAYYPLFQTIDGTVSPLKEMRTASGVVVLEAVPAGEANKPFIAQQTVTYSDASGQAGQAMDVRRSTGFVGPNRSFPTAVLHTTVLAWGAKAESEYTANQYDLKIVDENGYEPSDLNRSTTLYPFASIPVVECDLTLRADNMTKAGWVGDGEDIGLKARLSQWKDQGEGEDPALTLLREITLPFRAIDLTNVPQVDQDENVTGMLVNMSAASALEAATSAFTDMMGDKAVGKLANGLLNITGGINSSNFKMLVTPSDDPTVFNALIWAGYDKLELADVDYSNNGVAVGLYSGEFEVGLPSRDKISDMARGTYLPVSRSSKHRISVESTGADLKLQLEGFYEAEIRYDRETGEWKVYTKGGGFTAGVGVEFGFDVNTMAGPVPLTASFRVGGAVQLSFQTALRYNQGDDPVNDFLTNLRLNAYVKAFGGVGFDYSIVALKIGLFGELSVDSQNKFLTREENGDLRGQQLTLNSRVGIKFVVECLFISYEAVLASVDYQNAWDYNDWKAIDEYWSGAGTGFSLQSLRYAAAANGLAVASATATLQSRDYLEQYARTWGEPQARMALFSLDTSNGLANLQTNANPTSFPEISDDGQVLVYISDSNNSSIYASRAHYSILSNGSYGASSEITGPADFTGFGDSDVDIAGTGSFAAAAWVRLSKSLPQDAGEKITLADQNTLMNGAEIVASIYSNGSWTSKRLTNDSAPDLAPAVAANGSKAVVFWRSVVSNAESTGNADALLEFDARDCLMYSVYSNNEWSEPAMLYNGSNGSVKALQAAMLPDGTAVAVYTLDRTGVDASGNYSSYEIGYTIVTAGGELGTTMLATSDTDLDENPQVVTANFGVDDNRFVIGWHSLQEDGESNIQMLAVDENGAMTNDFPASLTALIRDGSAAVNGNFRFASMGQGDGIGNLTVLWSETVEDETTPQGLTVAAHSELKAAKLLRSDDANYRLSAPLEVAVLPGNNLADHFSAYLSGDQVKAVIQATEYSNANQKEIEGVLVPGEETKLYTATSQFEKYAVEVDAIGVDYENLALNSLTPIQFQIRNTGLEAVSGLKVTVAGTETAALTDSLQPGESATLTVWHDVGGTVSNPDYAISGDNNIGKSGTVYLDYPDVGISQMKVLKEEAGKRTIAMTLYNASAATLAGKNRTVNLAFYTNNLLTEKATVTCNTDGVAVSNNTITISGETNLARIDGGAFTLVLTYDVGSYVKNTLEEEEIPDSGVYLYADAWTQGKVGTQTEPQRLPEAHSADNQTAVLLTGAYARTGHQETSLNVEQGTDANGNTTAEITLTNNCLQEYEGGNLLAVLLNEQGEPLESQIVNGVAHNLAGEISDNTQKISFGQAGQRVLVYPILVDEMLRFEGLPITAEDFRLTSENNWELTYQILETDSAPNLLITAYSQDGVQIGGEDLKTGGAEAVSLQELKWENAERKTIEMQVGNKYYTLTLLPQDDGTVYPQEPHITTQPQDAAYSLNETPNSLTVEAQVSDGGTLSYQWYSCDERGHDITFIPNAAEASYTPPTDQPGTYYYICGVTNTLPDGLSKTAYSQIVKIVVTDGTALPEVTITFNAGSGSVSPGTAKTVNRKLSNLPTPTREGYTFNGWFTAPTGGVAVTTDTTFPSDTTLYARWTKNGEEPGDPDHGGSSGGGGGSSYQITVEDSSNGQVTTDRKTAYAGSTVTLTVTPDDGYVLDTLTVTDSRGNELKLTDKGSGKYTFTMPSSKVTVEASFAPLTGEVEDPCDGGADCPSRAFTDLSTTAWYHEAVDYVLVGGIMGGYGNGLFGPNDSLSRAQLCQILYNREGKPTATGSSPFTDVADTAWYADAVVWASSKGIVGGYGGGLFGPNDPITREQLAAILWRYAQYRGYDVSIGEETNILSYTDAFAVSEYAIPAMQWACGTGVVGGYEDKTLRPQNTATRAQVAQMLKNFFENLKGNI